jgi:hypothetical protein
LRVAVSFRSPLNEIASASEKCAGPFRHLDVAALLILTDLGSRTIDPRLRLYGR